MRVSGWVRVKKKLNGVTIWEHQGQNLVVSAGRNLIAQLVKDDAVNEPSHMAVGSSAVGTDDAMTALQGTEHERVAATVARSNNTLTYSAAFGAGLAADKSCAEFGIFNAAAAGTMLARFTTPVFTLEAAATLDVDWALTFGD